MSNKQIKWHKINLYVHFIFLLESTGLTQLPVQAKPRFSSHDIILLQRIPSLCSKKDEWVEPTQKHATTRH